MFGTLFYNSGRYFQTYTICVCFVAFVRKSGFKYISMVFELWKYIMNISVRNSMKNNIESFAEKL